MTVGKRKHQYSPEAAKKRLRRLLLLFFIGISLPVYFLFERVYSQLENEAFFRLHNQAQLLVEQVDQRLYQLIEQEQARPIAEYSFFNVLESPLLQSTGVKFSPLSSLPPTSAIPALTGYFQIDPDGSFHIPQLPTELNNQVVLSTDELANRIRLKNRLQQLLAISVGSTKDKADVAADSQEQRPAMAAPAAPVKQSYRFDEVMPQVESDAFGDQTDAAAGVKNQVLSETKAERLSEQVLGEMNIDAERYNRKSQEQRSIQRLRKTKKSAAKLSRKEIVKLPKQAVVDKYLNQGRQKVASSPYRPDDDAAPLSEAEVSSDNIASAPPTTTDNRAQLAAAVNVFSFESEVGSMQMLMLDRHLCFFRQVWYQNSRYVQGFVVDTNDFFNSLLMPLVNGSQGLDFSGVLLAHEGRVISHFNSAESSRETLIYRSHLSSPFQGMEVIVNSTAISTGSEAMVVDSLAAVLASIVFIGLIWFYRLGVGQIDLVARQRNFISAVSHELKTPLTSIRMYGEMLRSGWVVEEEKKHSYYDFIYFESERLSRLINNVLQLARLENNRKQPDMRALDPGLLLQRLVEQVGLQIEASGFTLQVLSGGNERGVIQVDEDAMTQIMINLVDNAIKFSGACDAKQVDIGFRVGSDKSVSFFVRDYGSGIAKQQMKKIFQLFYRVGDELTRTQPGTGIGLALVVQLAEAMQAKVDLVNRDPGAEFQVKFSFLEVEQ